MIMKERANIKVRAGGCQHQIVEYEVNPSCRWLTRWRAGCRRLVVLAMVFSEEEHLRAWEQFRAVDRQAVSRRVSRHVSRHVCRSCSPVLCVVLCLLWLGLFCVGLVSQGSSLWLLFWLSSSRDMTATVSSNAALEKKTTKIVGKWILIFRSMDWHWSQSHSAARWKVQDASTAVAASVTVDEHYVLESKWVVPKILSGENEMLVHTAAGIEWPELL